MAIEPEPAPQNRRGPLRPERLASARSRLRGGALARLVQACDLLLLLGLFQFKCRGDALLDPNLLLIAASVLVAIGLKGVEAYQLTARERLGAHLYRVLGAVGGSGLATLAFVALTSTGAAK